jgi:putative ATPase
MNGFKQPLADLARPKTFNDIVGQSHLFGVNGAIRKMTANGYIPNMMFWGPPGTGKTTAANIIAEESHKTLHKLNATSATIADVKNVISETKSIFGGGGVLLYLDEIQYFNKKQQQTLLEYMEDGRITLIASTTENPYLYVYNAVISRSAVFEFKALTAEDIKPAVIRAAAMLGCTLTDDVTAAIADAGAGDVRRSLNILETAFYINTDGITAEAVKLISDDNIGNFDKSGTVHYDLLSALQKSVRGSDPDAAVFYLAKILEGGDLPGACRRLQVMASEDVGLAYSMCAAVVRACVESARDLGMPEAAIPLSHAVILLATAPKSNSADMAYMAAAADIKKGKGLNIPSHMRPSSNYGGYLYPHDYENHYIAQQYLPDDIKNAVYYQYGENKAEQAAKAFWDKIKAEQPAQAFQDKIKAKPDT